MQYLFLFLEGVLTFISPCLLPMLPIYVSYFRQSDKTYIFDAPIRYSELSAKYKTREQIAKYLCDRCNELGKMQFDQNGKPIVSQEKKETKKSKLA